MKIAYLTNCFGAQSHTFIRREVHQLAKRGMEVELFGIRPDISPKLNEADRALTERTCYLYPLRIVPVLWLNLVWAITRPTRYWPTLWLALANPERKVGPHLKLIYHFFVSSFLARAMERSGVQHIHAHFMNVSATMAMYASRLTGIPYSVTIHSAGTRNAPHIIGIPMKLKYARFLLMISHYNIDYFNEVYPCRHKSHVVRCGMDLDQFPFRGAVPKAESGQAPLRVVAVGRFVEKKGFRYLLDAVARVRDLGLAVQLQLVGTGPLEADLKQQRQDLALQEQVHFYGAASSVEVREQMLGADVVVVPSVTSRSGEMEGIPVVLMEAMALGVPVISTRHSGIPELVQDNITGLLVNERDTEALALALQQMAQRPQQLDQWVRQARQLIENEFNIQVVASQRRDLFLQYQ